MSCLPESPETFGIGTRTQAPPHELGYCGVGTLRAECGQAEYGDTLHESGHTPLEKWNWLFRKLFFRLMRRIHVGRLVIQENGARHEFIGTDARTSSVVVKVHHPRFYRRVVLNGSLGAAESYRQGEWDSDDLEGLFQWITRNANVLSDLDWIGKRLFYSSRRFYQWLRRNSRSGSRRNISLHYDLSNEFFGWMLDSSMTYSAGIFSRSGMTLAEAQREKIDRICRKVQLAPGDRLLEIGTGWGSFAEYAARHFGCHVTTTTISQQQFEYANERFRWEGLESQIDLLSQDYRDLSGSFDKLVSIEMIEAVGERYLDTYFEACARLLKPGGTMCLQTITIPDQRYEKYRKSTDFIQRYIFPGGCLPSLGSILRAVSKRTDLRLEHVEEFGLDYAKTLNHWRRNFWTHIDKIRTLGFDSVWIRTWEYYLCYCMAGFREKQIGLSQLVFTKPHWDTSG